MISAGGTYTGNWQSLDHTLAAVTVSTSAPVIIENCTITSAGDGIQDWWGNANVTVRNCLSKALNPNVAGVPKGFFIVLRNFSSLVVEHNLIEGFQSAVNANNYPAGVGETTTGQTVIFRYNVVNDHDGRFSDGHGGYQPGSPDEGTVTWSSARRSTPQAGRANDRRPTLVATGASGSTPQPFNLATAIPCLPTSVCTTASARACDSLVFKPR